MRVILFSKCWRFNKFNMLTNSPKISDITKGVSPTELLLEQWKNMIKQPSCIFKQCLGPFNMFTVKGYSETGLFRHLCNLVVFNFRIHKLWRSSCFWKCWKCNADLRNAEKNWEKFVCFFDNCISIDCDTFSQLQREYLSAAVNVFASSLQILDITKRDFFRLNSSQSDEKIR